MKITRLFILQTSDLSFNPNLFPQKKNHQKKNPDFLSKETFASNPWIQKMNLDVFIGSFLDREWLLTVCDKQGPHVRDTGTQLEGPAWQLPEEPRLC